MAFDKAKKEEVREIGARPWNIPVESDIKPIYRCITIIILGTEVTVSKERYVDDIGSFLQQGAKGTIKEAIIREDTTVYGVYFKEVHWVFDTPCGIQGEVSEGTFHLSIEEMDEMGIVIEGREVK